MLDEITEMPLDLQAKLLRVLEERLVRRIGGSRTTPVDFRLITSSNRAPEDAVKEGRLRQDLYFRINTVTITLPPLRERTGDIALLARHYLQRFAARHGRTVETISPEAYRRLLVHPWPGNVRELEHAIERAVLVARGPEIGVADLPESLGVSTDAAASAGPLPGSLEEIERASILRALESTNWNKQAAAALLGLRRPTLYSKMRKHGIPQRRT
jgi:transcriptional regulator with PAS, ATPase and Fis domain